jgi:RHS repeat-associated protein
MVYDPYGFVIFRAANFTSGATNSLNFNNLWQGGWRDLSTNLTNFQARWYSVTLRWVSGEPSGGSYVDGMNLYVPMQNNPLSYGDPTGLEGIPTGGKGGPANRTYSHVQRGVPSGYTSRQPTDPPIEPWARRVLEACSPNGYTSVYLRSNGLHAYLLLVQPDGTEIAYRAGFHQIPWIVTLPVVGGYSGYKISGSPGASAGTIIGSGISSAVVATGGPTSFGPIIAVSGPYGPGFDDYNPSHESVLIAVREGKTDWESIFDRIEREVNSRKIPYMLVTQNSNSYVYTLLRAIGEDSVPYLPGWASPGWGQSLLQMPQHMRDLFNKISHQTQQENPYSTQPLFPIPPNPGP